MCEALSCLCNASYTSAWLARTLATLSLSLCSYLSYTLSLSARLARSYLSPQIPLLILLCVPYMSVCPHKGIKYVYVCIYIHTYVCIYIHTYVCMCVCVCLCVCVCVYVCMLCRRNARLAHTAIRVLILLYVSAYCSVSSCHCTCVLIIL